MNRNSAKMVPWPADVSPTLNAHFGSKQGLEDQHVNGGGDCLYPPVAMCLITKTRLDSETETLIPTTGGVFDVAGTLIGRGENAGPQGSGADVSGAMFTLTKTDVHAVAFGGDIARSQQAAVAMPMQVRRLTAEECEKLQGFLPGYTNIPWRGKPESPDGPRYKALGNSMAVPVMRWIGERINKVEAL